MLESLSIIIPSYNGKAVLEKCLGILAEIARDAEVIVVDGGSSDGSPELVEKHFAWAQLLRVSNHGWAHATNRGFAIAKGEILITMNSDLFATRAALEMMVSRLQANPGLGGVAPVLNHPDGRRQRFFSIFWPANWSAVHTPIRTNLLPGACMAVTRKALERVGLFDENFFFYNEEFDWCWRAAKAGFGLELIPERVIHVEGGSTNDNPNFQIEAQRGALYLIDKHFSKFWSEAFRAWGELFCWLASDLDPRINYRPAWTTVHSITKRRAYLESPFPLSGRGEIRFGAANPESTKPEPGIEVR
jgi:GT2 family glycosyltransferase